MPDRFTYITTIPVRITDINYGGHVSNNAILGIIHEARIQYLLNYGYTEMDMAGVSLIMADVAINFEHEVFYGDLLKVSVVATNFTRVGFDVYYKLQKENDSTQINVALAKTGMVCYNYPLKKICSVPQVVIKSLSNTE